MPWQSGNWTRLNVAEIATSRNVNSGTASAKARDAPQPESVRCDLFDDKHNTSPTLAASGNNRPAFQIALWAIGSSPFAARIAAAETTKANMSRAMRGWRRATIAASITADSSAAPRTDHWATNGEPNQGSCSRRIGWTNTPFSQAETLPAARYGSRKMP